MRWLLSLPVQGRILSVWLALTAALAGQTQQTLRVDTLDVGQRPLGVAITGRSAGPGPGLLLWAGVANAGSNSLSIVNLTVDSSNPQDLKEIMTIRGHVTLPASPYAVVSCAFGELLVTMPAERMVALVNAEGLRVTRTIRVDGDPYSAICYGDASGSKIVVSLKSQDVLLILDFQSGAEIARISNIAGSEALHGMVILYGTTLLVTGTERGVVTVVDLPTLRMLGVFPVAQPTSIGPCQSTLCVASRAASSILLISTTTFQVIGSISGITNPVDFVDTVPFATVVTTGSAGSVLSVSRDLVLPLIANVPGAAGIEKSVTGPQNTGHLSFVLVASSDTNRLFMLQPGPMRPAEVSGGNAASAVRPAAPGGLASVFVTTGVSSATVVQSLPLPTRVAGVSLRVGGTLEYTGGRWVYSATGALEAPLLFVGPRQVNFQVPPAVAPGDAVPVQLVRPDGTTALGTIRVAASAPALFTLAADGTGQTAALNQDGSLNFGTNPARRGSVIQLFATGAGATVPLLAPGEAAPAGGTPLVQTIVQPTVTIGHKPARVLFSGLAPGFVGLWQINAEIPLDVTPAGTVGVVVSAAGLGSNSGTIAVQ